MPSETTAETRVIDTLLGPVSGGDVHRFSCSSIAKFLPLPGEDALELLTSDLFDPEDACDASPNAAWFVKFTQKFRGRCWLIGYRVGDERDDRRISIEGILIEQMDLAKDGNTLGAQRTRVYAEAADRLLKSKEPDECALYTPGPSNTLDVPVIRYWWD